MNVRVMLIEPTTDPKTFNVSVLIGKTLHNFPVPIETDTIDPRKPQIPHRKDLFWEIFQFDRIVAVQIYNLVSKVSNKQVVELPTDIESPLDNKIVKNNKFFNSVKSSPCCTLIL